MPGGQPTQPGGAVPPNARPGASSGGILPGANVKKTGRYGSGLFGEEASGPFVIGAKRDKHNLGTDADGNPVNAGHLGTDAYFFMDEQYDGPLHFVPDAYPRPDELPIKTRVHLVWDDAEPHRFVGGVGQGKWKWYGEAPEAPTGGRQPGVPEPTDPTTPPPPTPGPGPTTPPPIGPGNPTTPRPGQGTPPTYGAPGDVTQPRPGSGSSTGSPASPSQPGAPGGVGGPGAVSGSNPGQAQPKSPGQGGSYGNPYHAHGPQPGVKGWQPGMQPPVVSPPTAFGPGKLRGPLLPGHRIPTPEWVVYRGEVYWYDGRDGRYKREKPKPLRGPYGHLPAGKNPDPYVPWRPPDDWGKPPRGHPNYGKDNGKPLTRPVNGESP